MNTKRILIAILLLIGLTLSGCFLPPPPSVGYGRGGGHAGHARTGVEDGARAEEADARIGGLTGGMKLPGM